MANVIRIEVLILCLLTAPTALWASPSIERDGEPRPLLREACHDLHIALLSLMPAHRDIKRIALPRRLDQLAAKGCRLNPRESIGRMQAAIHLVIAP